MEKTGNSIVVNRFSHFVYEMQPVMRNGKPTKRTKEVRINVNVDATAFGCIIDGHEVFIDELDCNDDTMTWARVYRADGTRLTCVCKFGRTGQADHESTYNFDKKSQSLVTFASGYNGATFHGAGATIKRVNW